MQQARYFCSGSVSPSDYHHYGLAAPIYTHFTSPIRRYSDQMVHRLLAAVIRWEAVAADSRDRTLKRPPLWQVPQLASRALAALGSSATPPPPPPWGEAGPLRTQPVPRVRKRAVCRAADSTGVAPPQARCHRHG